MTPSDDDIDRALAWRRGRRGSAVALGGVFVAGLVGIAVAAVVIARFELPVGDVTAMALILPFVFAVVGLYRVLDRRAAAAAGVDRDVLAAVDKASLAAHNEQKALLALPVDAQRQAVRTAASALARRR